MYDSRKTAPTFLVYAGGWVFLGGLAFAWGIGAASGYVLELFGRPVAATVAAGASAQPIGTSTLMIEKIPDPPPSPYYTFRPRYRHPSFTLGPDAPAWLRALIVQEFGATMS